MSNHVDDIRRPVVCKTTGRYKVDKSGRQIGKPGHIVQWINGEQALVLQEDIATAKIVFRSRVGQR